MKAGLLRLQPEVHCTAREILVIAFAVLGLQSAFGLLPQKSFT